MICHAPPPSSVAVKGFKPGDSCWGFFCALICCSPQSKNRPHLRGEYNVYSTFQSHEPEFDYLKSLEIEEKINKIRWLPQQNAAHFLLSTNGERPRLGFRLYAHTWF